MVKDNISVLLGKLVNPSLIIGLAVVARLAPHPPNFAPIAAMALFGGAYLNKRYALLLPLIALFLGDIFIGFYSPVVMFSVYGSFLLVGLIGLWLRNRKNPQNVIAAAIISSLLFFLITNASVWILGAYPRGIEGLAASYTAGIPFLKNTLLGNLFYSVSFFGGYELALKIVNSKKLALVKEKI